MAGVTPTLRDVAKLAGVSLGTASNVMNNRVGVSDEIRIKVLEAAQSLHYEMQIRGAKSTPPTLSVVGTLGKIEDGAFLKLNPFYSHVLIGIERECERHGLSLMYANIQVDKLNRPAKLPLMLLDNRIDGVLIVGAFLQDTIDLIEQKVEKPVVLVDAYAPGNRFDSVLTDNINGAYAAVTYLIEQGHRHIGLVGSAAYAYPSIQDRRSGYLQALKQHNIHNLYIIDSALNREGGYNATCSLLQRSPEITAIFACNDEAALGVLNAARQMGRSIPQDLSVIGFDDIDLAHQVSPTLTTMRVDKILLGTLAVRHLRDRAENRQRPTLTTIVGAQMVVRNSVTLLHTSSPSGR